MDQGNSATLGSPPPATGTFALDLSREGITLYWLSSHAVWNAVEHVVLQEGLVAERMGQLRARIGGLPAPAQVDVWLPEDQIIVRVLDTGGAAPSVETIAELFADMQEPLEFDAEVRPGAAAYTIAAIPRAVLEQTRDFLLPQGFGIDSYTVRDAPAGMDRAPVFSLDPPAPAARPVRFALPRVSLAAAGAGLLVGGGLLAALLTGALRDGSPRVSLVEIDGPRAVATGGGPGQMPGGTPDGDGRAGAAAELGIAGTRTAFSGPANPLSTGRAQIDLPRPPTPALAEAVGPLPQDEAAPARDSGPRAVLAAAAPPKTPAIYARPVQTEMVVPVPPYTVEAKPPPAARQWTPHLAALPGQRLAPADGAGARPDLSALRVVQPPAASATDPAQGRPVADAPPAAPASGPGAYVAMLPGELDVPAAAPAVADLSGARSRPASVPPQIMLALAMPDAAGDAPAFAPRPDAGVPRPDLAAAPVAVERSAPPPEFALSAPPDRPFLTAPADRLAAPAAEPAPAGPVQDTVRSLPAPVELAALGAPSGPLPPADLSGVRSRAMVDTVLDKSPVRPAPATASSAPPRPASESALTAMLLDILAAAPAGMAPPAIDAEDRQPRARVATQGLGSDTAGLARIASLSAAPPVGATGLNPPALAVQPLDLDTPTAAESHDDLASLLSPGHGVQVGRAFDPQQARPAPDGLPQLQGVASRTGRGAESPRPAGAAAAPESVAATAAPGSVPAGAATETVDVAALATVLPRAQVVSRGTVPPLPDIEFVALDRTPRGDAERLSARRGPAMAAPSSAPGVVAVPLPAPASDGAGVKVVVINASPDIVPPRRPVPEVIEARPDILPPLRDRSAPATEVAALTDPDATPETADDATDLAVARQIRPRPRPPEVEVAETARLASLAPSELALNRTDSPRPRPSDLARVQPQPAAPAASAPAAPAVSAPQPKQTVPNLPSSASVARAATIENALPFGRMSLIGVFGSTRNRHALVRLRNGNFIKVHNGESVDGYQVTGMNSNSVRLRRGGRETILVIPE